MPKSKETSVVLPPRISIGALSNRFAIILKLVWGNYEREIKIPIDEAGTWNKLVEHLNHAFLEASEMKLHE